MPSEIQTTAFETWAMKYYSCDRIELIPEQARAAWDAGVASVVPSDYFRGYSDGMWKRQASDNSAEYRRGFRDGTDDQGKPEKDALA